MKGHEMAQFRPHNLGNPCPLFRVGRTMWLLCGENSLTWSSTCHLCQEEGTTLLLSVMNYRPRPLFNVGGTMRLLYVVVNSFIPSNTCHLSPEEGTTMLHCVMNYQKPNRKIITELFLNLR
ncbi:hypothetical protein C0J52_03069 [Blattella germanica]|nr:hypothetical protein C0J52_03069 [Blattella germanica]